MLSLAGRRRDVSARLKQWETFPLVDKRFDTRAHDSIRECVVCLGAFRAFRLILDARRRAFQNEGSHSLRPAHTKMEGGPPAHRVAEHIHRLDVERVQQSRQVARAPVQAVALKVGGRRRTTVADGVQGYTPCKRGDGRAHLIPGTHTAGETVQKEERWPVTIDLDVELEIIQAHQRTGAATAAFSASATTTQTSRCKTTFRARSVGTSTTHKPPLSSPELTALCSDGQSATRTY